MNNNYFDRIPPEKWQALEKEMYIEAYQAAIVALVDGGDNKNALNQMRPVMRMSGHAFAINMIKMFDIQGDDLEKISNLCSLYEELFSHDLIEIERTPGRLIRAGGSHCLWQGTLKEGCIGGHEMLLNGICEQVNPDYHCRFTQMKTKGDPLCSYVIEKKT